MVRRRSVFSDFPSGFSKILLLAAAGVFLMSGCAETKSGASSVGSATSAVAAKAVAMGKSWKATQGDIAITVDADGHYEIAREGKAWLVGGETALHTGGKWYSTQPGPDRMELKGGTPAVTTGEDSLGAFQEYRRTWDAGGTAFETAIRLYADSSVVFEQKFPNGAEGVALADAESMPRKGDLDEFNYSETSSAFPTFRVEGKLSKLRYLTFHDRFAIPVYGVGLAKAPSGLDGGVPLSIYDDQLRTIIVSPINSFKTAFQSRPAAFPNQYVCGVSGLVKSFPAGFTSRTIVYSGQGVNATYMAWGSKLLGLSGKDRSGPSKDFTVNNLGYWTDNGAYYYYHTVPDKNYEKTLADVHAYNVKEGLPFNYYQLDSWWYPKGPSKGVAAWVAAPDIFPSGLAPLHKELGTGFVMHNRYFDPNTEYAKKYKFIVEKRAACPMDGAFWDMLFAEAKGIGCLVYEQDWLDTQLRKTNALLSDTHSAHEWLTHMAESAQKAGLPIQYCMAFPSDFLQSTEFPAVTQIRVSGDYRLQHDQWRIGTTSMLAHSLGMASFKDTFWTSVQEPGAKYGDKTEPNAVIQTLVSALSAGPVGPGDGIGLTDKQLLMRVCRQDGLLLKADTPATTVDKTFLSGGKNGDVWSSDSTHDGRSWHYVFAAEVKTLVTLTAADFGATGPHVALNYMTGETRTFDDKTPLEITVQPNGVKAVPFSYTVVAPAGPNGWTLIGEREKFVTMSKQRFTKVSADGLSVELAGVPGEAIELVWVAPKTAKSASAASGAESLPAGVSYDGAKKLVTVKTAIGKNGTAAVTVKAE